MCLDAMARRRRGVGWATRLCWRNDSRYVGGLDLCRLARARERFGHRKGGGEGCSGWQAMVGDGESLAESDLATVRSGARGSLDLINCT